MLQRILVCCVLLAAATAASASDIRRQALREAAEVPGPRAAVAGDFEYFLSGDRIQFRHATGPANEPFQELALPGAGLKIAATPQRLYVWLSEWQIVAFPVGPEGPEASPQLLAPDAPESLAALQPPASAVVQRAAAPGREEVVINPPRLYVPGSALTFAVGAVAETISVFNTATGQASTIRLIDGDTAYDIVLTADNTRGYVSNLGPARGITIFDPSTLRINTRILGRAYGRLALSRDGQRLYSDADDTLLQAFDTSSNSVVASRTVPSVVQSLQLTADGRTLFVLAGSSSTNIFMLLSYTAATLTETARVTLPSQAGVCGEMALSPDERRLWVSCRTSPGMLVVDTANLSVLNRLSIERSFGMTFSPDGTRLYTSHFDLNTLGVIDTATGTRLKQIRVGDLPGGVVLNQTATQIYVVNVRSRTVSIVDFATDAVVNTYSVGLDPFYAALSNPSPRISATPAQITFNAAAGQANPPAQTVALSVDRAGVSNWGAAATTQSGGNWLAVTAASGTFPGSVSISANISGLAAGTYNGTVTITAPEAGNSPVTISVSLQVAASGGLALNSRELAFTSLAGAPAPPSQTVQVTNTDSTAISWTAAVTTPGATWLSATPSSGTTPGTLTVAVNPQGLAAGRYEASVAVSSTQVTNSPQTIAVVYIVLPGPSVPAGGLVNAASFAQAAAVAAGSLVSVFGANFGPAAPLGASAVPLPTTLGDVRVLLGGIAAPLVFVSATQINCQVPFELSGQASTSLVVQSGSAASPSVTVALAAAAPGIFTATLGARTQGAILNKDGSLNTPENPARPGDVVQIFATGQGAVSNQPASGAAAGSSPLSVTPNNPVVLIGGRQADVVFSGLTPGLVGLWQINAVVPAAATAGSSVEIQVILGGAASNSTVMAIANPATP